MLKSTYRTAALSQPAFEESALPPEWTEHEAPSGRSYYYNSDTKQSTYTRPTETVLIPTQGPFHTFPDLSVQQPNVTSFAQFTSNATEDQLGRGHGSFRGGRSYQGRAHRNYPQDRPKTKAAIPNCAPWILVMTKMRRRFVHNPDTSESFWKFPQDVMLAVIEMDRWEREHKEKPEREIEDGMRSDGALSAPAVAAHQSQTANGQDEFSQHDSDSYEEVEVTDDEGTGVEDIQVGPAKRQRTDNDDTSPRGPVEFNEEDIAFQLAQMGQEYGLDPAEYDEENDEYDEGLPLSTEESTALFRDLLDDFHINPYSTWEQITSDGKIIDDSRYVVLPNMSARRAAFTEWSRDRIAELQERREKEEKRDPRIAYLSFLHEHATPKLYWPEFKRKFKKEPGLKDAHLADRDREKMYRDHISRLKLPESTRKADLRELLKIEPLNSMNRSTTLDTLPQTLLTNLKFISLPARTRDALVEAYISTLPLAPEPSTADPSSEEQATREREKEERHKRDAALADRAKHVEEAKRKQRGALRHGREMLRDGEAELDRAMRVGKEGLRGYMQVDLGHSTEIHEG